MHTEHYLVEVVYFLMAAVVIVPIFKRLNLSAVLGYLVAGFIIGPSILGVIKAEEHILVLAEFGIVFLMFLIGMELSFDRLKMMRRDIFGIGGTQVVATGIAIGGVSCFFIGLGPTASIIVACALALSSTAFVMQMIMERQEQITYHGRLSIAILLMQDLAVVPILALLPVLAQGSGTEGGIGTALLEALATATVAVIAIVILGRVILAPVYRMVAVAKVPELFLAVTLLILVGSGVAMVSMGISMTLSAFLCGVLIAETEYHHQVEADIGPFKGMLLGLFFMTVGMGIDVNLIQENLLNVVLLLVGMLGLKFLLISLSCFVFGTPWPVSGRVGMLLGQGGEFAFVILATATMHSLIADNIAQTITAVVVLSMIATPFLDWMGQKWNAMFHAVQDEQLTDIKGAMGDFEGHVVIAGFGRVGKMAAQMLGNLGVPYVALDMDQNRVRDCLRNDLTVFYGDATSLNVMRDSGVDRACAVLLTLDNKQQVNKAIHMLRQNFPEVPIISRSRDETHARELETLGVVHSVPELTETSLQLGATVLREVGVSEDAVTDVLLKMRQEEEAA